MKLNTRADINSLPTYEANTHYAEIIVDANESPINPPVDILSKINQIISEHAFNRYPQISASDLRTKIADRYAMTPANVQVGNGSSSMLNAFCQLFTGCKIMYPEPSFSMYQVYTQLAQAQGIAYRLDDDFNLDIPALIEQIKQEQPDMVMICNPNNPTGNYTHPEDICRILSVTDALVLVDEAYIEFASDSCVPYLQEYDNLVILRTFSKAYALANLRLGYVLAAPPVIEQLSKLLLPYQVNGLTLAIGECVLSNIEAYQPQIGQLSSGRNQITTELGYLGFTVIPSYTNFVFFYHENKQIMQDLVEFLVQNLISVRNYTDKNILKNGIRLTVGTAQENLKVINAIKQFVKGI